MSRDHSSFAEVETLTGSATINRGLHVDAARYTIKHAIAERRDLTGFSQIEMFLPFSPWSDGKRSASL